jgi:branched-chain amino acid transport system permease protein
MDLFLQTTVLGVGAGAVDALLALGIVLIYRTTGVLNFAVAAVGAFACYVTYSVAQGRPLWLAAGAGLVAGMGMGIITYGAVHLVEVRAARVLDPSRVASRGLVCTVATLAVARLIEQIITNVWGTTTGAFPDPFGLSSVVAGGVTIPYFTVGSCLVAGGLTALLAALLRWTRVGTMVRAIADDPQAARLCGAPVVLLVGSVWAISGGLAGVAGFFDAHFAFQPSFLDPYLVPALIAAVLGGLRSVGGAFLAAVGLEVASSLFQTYATDYAAYTATFLSILLICVLLLAPRTWLSQGRRRYV